MKRFPLFPILLLCPPAGEITNISTPVCIERFGQIQRFIIQRTKDGPSTINWITIATTNPALLATWNDLKAATDNTKVQASPIIAEPNSEPGAAREYGGGNATPGGNIIVLGAEPTPFEAAFLDLEQKIVKEIKTYKNEINLSVFLVNGNNQIAGLADDPSNPTKFRGFPISPKSFFISDKGMGNRDNPDKNMIRWNFPENWSDNWHVITATDFDPLTQL